MKKPNDYGTTNSSKSHAYIELGGHKATPKKVEEYISKNGNETLAFYFDTTDDDTQPHYYLNRYEADDRPNKKWQGVIYITPKNKYGLSMLEGLCTAIERSNPGFQCWDENGVLKTDELKGKKIGVVIREEEYRKQDGSVGVSRKPFRFCTYDRAFEQEIPNKKKLRDSDGFVPADTFSEEGLPFG